MLRGARVVDGTGAPGRDATVVIADGLIESVGDAPEGLDGATVVDLDGLVLAPGFIDPHTHYDAQVLWDPDLTPSSWHGVTTVVMGNCGFGLAPTRPADRDTVMRVLENVEGMPLDALAEGIPWTFETFPEYLDALDALPAPAQRRAAPRPHAAALLRHGRRRDRARGHRRRGRGHAGDRRRGARGRSDRVLDVPLDQPRRRARPSGAEPGRVAGRARRAARAAARARHRLLRGHLGTRLPRRRGGGRRQAHRPAGVVGGDHGQQAPAR